MSDYGIKISQAGYDVKTANKERLIFSSAFDTFKVFAVGNGTQLVPHAPSLGSVTTVILTIAHNLGYKPAFWVYTDNPMFYTAGQLSPYSTRSVGVPAYSGIDYAVDSTNLYIYLNNSHPTNDYTFEYRFYIFYNQLV
jgi:hypothetical protein